jgi:L-asparaginase II
LLIISLVLMPNRKRYIGLETRITTRGIVAVPCYLIFANNNLIKEVNVPNPVIAEVTRGGLVESRHTGAFCVADAKGRVLKSAGDIEAPVFPRSAIKALQCVPLIETGAADHFGFSEEELALACSSHNGEAEHVRVARSMLEKAHTSEARYECGAHWPIEVEAHHEAVRTGNAALQVHNNCSGKHAGMLALARQLGADAKGYVKVDHPVQQTIAKTIAGYCDVDVAKLPWGIDGCSVPTWAFPLRNMALGFARLTGTEAGKRIITAVRNHPFMVAGTGRFDTKLMQAVPRAFIKVGAEGVYCGCVPHAGLGIAVKCDDGAGRAAETAMASVLASLDVWTADEKHKLAELASCELRNWRKIHVGDIHATVADR